MKRSKWKGIYTKPLSSNNTVVSSEKISRNSSIISKFINQVFKVYNGRNFKEITITKEMLGHKFGEFSRTRIAFVYKKKKKKKK